MKLLSGELRNLVTFGCARITSLSITFTNETQLILGTNGSGKSNLLRQLSPLPVARTDFLPNGYKKLVIEHDGHEYTLISDFSKKDSPHEFHEDGINLNEGGTTEVQRELVIQKLGWSSQVEDLCFNTHMYTKMGSSLRQAFFTKLNPYKINFILENSKKAKTRIRNCKAILNRLQERKTVLENQLLAPEFIKIIRDEHKTLLDQSSFLNKMIIRIGTILDTTKPIPPAWLKGESPKQHLLKMVSEVKSLEAKVWRIGRASRDVDRDNPKEQLSQLQENEGALLERRRSIEASLIDLYEARRKNEANLNDCVDEDVLLRLNTELLSLEAELHELLKACTDDPLPESVLDKESVIVGRFDTTLCRFMDDPDDLMSRKTYDRKQRHLAKWSSYLFELRRTIRVAQSNIATWEKTLSLKLSDIPDEPCSKMKCPLYVSFKTSHDRTRANIELETRVLHDFFRKESRVSNYLSRQEEQLKAQEPYQEALRDLFDLIREYPSFHRFFSKADTLAQIGRNPEGLLNRIKEYFRTSRNAYAVPKLKERILKAQLNYAQHKTLSGKEKTHLTSMLHETDEKIAALTEQLSGVAHELQQTVYFRDTVTRYWGVLEEARKYTADLETLSEYCTKQYDLEQLKLLQDELQEKTQGILSRLADIQKTLQDQDRLHDRLSSEILEEIKNTEAEKATLELLGDALEALPQEYTLRFMNALFDSANAFISKVFTYRLALYPMNSETWKSYKIPYKARTTDGPDISKCSTAQAEIINLALTLACRQSEGLCDYPLFLDEVGKNFDPTHQQRLLDLVLFITDNHLASQLFIVNHHAVIHGGLMHTETLVLDDSNIMKTENYNSHAVIETY